MAVTVDSAVNSTSTAFPGTSLTRSHTCSGSNIVLIAMTRADGTNKTATGVTYNGVAMSLAGSKARGDGAAPIQIWYLVGAASGTHDIVASYSESLNLYMQSASFNGGNAVTNYNSAGGTSTAVSVAITSATNDMVVDFFSTNNYGTGPTVGAGQTQITAADSGTIGSLASSYESGAASVTMSWTISPSQEWWTSGVNIVSGSQGGTTSNPHMLSSSGVGA